MNADEEKNRLFEIISRHMRINGSEYCSTSEFESDIEDAAEEIYNEITTLRAQLAEARVGLEKIAYLEDCNISGSEYRIGVADGCRTSATIARKYLEELNKVTTA